MSNWNYSGCGTNTGYIPDEYTDSAGNHIRIVTTPNTGGYGPWSLGSTPTYVPCRKIGIEEVKETCKICKNLTSKTVIYKQRYSDGSSTQLIEYLCCDKCYEFWRLQNC